MKRCLDKIAAILIVISVISGNTVSVFGADITQNIDTVTSVQAKVNIKSVFTLDEAIKSAIGNSGILALDEKKINYMEKVNDINEKIDDNPQLVGRVEIEMSDERKNLNEDTRDIKLKQCKQQRDFDEDKLIQKVTTSYNNIVTSQMKIDKLKKDIHLKERDLNIARVKSNVGSAVSVEIDVNSIVLEDLKDKLKSNESSLKDAEYDFKNLTGKDVSEYSLEQDIPFNKLTIDGSVDEYLDNVVESYLKYSTQIIELNKDYFNDADNKVPDVSDNDKPKDVKPTFVSNDSTDLSSLNANLEAYEAYLAQLDGYYQERYTYAFKLSGRLAYLNAKLGTYESETNLNEAKKQFKEQLRNFYTMLTTTENNINLLKRNIEFSNKQLRISKVKYDSELITKLDYDHQVVNSQELDIQLRCAIDRYNTLKEEIQKPWIVFSK